MDYDQAAALIKRYVPEPHASELCRWLSSTLQPARQQLPPNCPNCSRSDRLYPMRPVPPDFVELENATHECARCGFKIRV